MSRPGVGNSTAGVAGAGSRVGRDRNGRPIVGSATVRPPMVGAPSDGSFLFVPVFSPWGSWSPWYSSGYNWNLGYTGFDPWGYGGTRWFYGRYGGLWYDPYAYYPYDPFDRYRYEPTPYDYGGRTPERAPIKHVTGSIRLRVNPATAKVYVDGTLMGTVDDFDGLTHHLDIAPGTHALEFRADGYLPHVTTIKVTGGQTVTERATLKKKK